MLGAYLGCVKYLDAQGVSGCPGSSWGSGAKEAKTHPGFREYLVGGGARFRELLEVRGSQGKGVSPLGEYLTRGGK